MRHLCLSLCCLLLAADFCMAADQSPGEVLFHPVFTRGAPGSPIPLDVLGVIPIGDRIDAIWTTDVLYLMKDKGRPRPVWQSPTLNGNSPIQLGLDPGHDSVAFDGKYIWVCARPLPVSIFIIDPVSEKTWAIKPTGVLPMVPVGPAVDGRAAVLPVAPGRACVALYNGTINSLSMVQFDPARGPDVGLKGQVFLTYDKQKGDPLLVPGAMMLLKNPDPKSHQQQMIISRIGRGYPSPLLIDPESLQVKVAPEKMKGLDPENSAQRDGMLYWELDDAWGPTQHQLNIHTVGFPDFTTRTVAESIKSPKKAQTGDRVFYFKNHFFIASRQWWVADALDKPFAPLHGDTPDRLELGKNAPADQEYVMYLGFSNFYGVVCFTSFGIMYEVEFRNLSKPVATASPLATQPSTRKSH